LLHLKKLNFVFLLHRIDASVFVSKIKIFPICSFAIAD